MACFKDNMLLFARFGTSLPTNFARPPICAASVCSLRAPSHPHALLGEAPRVTDNIPALTRSGRAQKSQYWSFSRVHRASGLLAAGNYLARFARGPQGLFRGFADASVFAEAFSPCERADGATASLLTLLEAVRSCRRNAPFDSSPAFEQINFLSFYLCSQNQ